LKQKLVAGVVPDFLTEQIVESGCTQTKKQQAMSERRMYTCRFFKPKKICRTMSVPTALAQAGAGWRGVLARR